MKPWVSNPDTACDCSCDIVLARATRDRTFEANLKSDFNLKANMAELEELRDTKEKGLDRILALSDGVFAFALTLLVLDLAVPAFGANQDFSALPGLWRQS